MKPLLVLALLAARAAAQLGVAPEINLFGNELVRELQSRQVGQRLVRVAGKSPATRAETVPGFAHALLFHDGRRLRGELQAVTPEEIVWSRPDASAPLRIAHGEVRRVVLSSDPRLSTSSAIRFSRPASEGSPRKPANVATVKLPGGDWLAGELTSIDGQTFLLRSSNGFPVRLPRAKVDWLFFGQQAAPAFGFAGGAMDLNGWTSSLDDPCGEVAGGVLTLRANTWIRRRVSMPQRFEVAFAVPAQAEESLRLWLQPSGLMSPNSYTTGTVELEFGPKSLARTFYDNGMQREQTALADSATDDQPIRYRIFYDHVGPRLIVVRNQQTIGEWTLTKANANDAENSGPARMIGAVCFDRNFGARDRTLQFRLIQVQPWDGAPHRKDAEVEGRDRLSVGSEAPQTGALELISDTEIGFSGTRLKREGELFVQLHRAEARPSLADANARLILGQSGEFSISDLEISSGVAHGRTSFASRLDFPVTNLQAIAFARRDPVAPPPADLLVFKNGDELRGTLLAAARGRPLRWKLANGQELEIQIRQVAGVRFTTGEKVRPEEAATFELRNGDRLRGRLGGLEGETLRLHHAELGELSLDRKRLGRFYPNAPLSPLEGGSEGVWWRAEIGEAAHASAAGANSWIYLDGHYVSRWVETASSRTTPALRRRVRSAMSRFEIRCDATNTSGGEPSIGILLATEHNTASARATISTTRVSLSEMKESRRQGPQANTIDIGRLLPKALSRMSVRVFVDSAQGFAHYYVDGVPVAKVGTQRGGRLPGFGETVTFTSTSRGEYPVILSNLWIGPWDGELPGAEPASPGTTLANGDRAPHAPVALRDGVFHLESESGMLEVPAGKVNSVDCGGVLEPATAPARVRLADGSALLVEDFAWDGRELTARSIAIGEVRVPASAVRELIYEPVPVRALAAPEKAPSKNDEEAQK